MLALSIDPGTVSSGWSLFEDGKPLACGKIRATASWTQSKRLGRMLDGIETLFDEYSPDVLVVEEQFTGVNRQTSLITARAMGIAIALAGTRGIRAIGITPPEVKKAVTGKGNADKSVVCETIQLIYDDSEVVRNIGPYIEKGKDKTDDIYDAVGINHSFWVLGDTRTVIKKDKNGKKIEVKESREL